MQADEYFNTHPPSSSQTTRAAQSIHETGALIFSSPRRHLRGRRGGLRDMPEMPLDILFEIFGFLHPKDLLNLSRATREFRALLMSRNSAPFWREARKLVEGLPEPPSYLSEPAYANLLFCAHCHNCSKPNIQAVHWLFSVRYCDPCRKAMFIDESEVSAFLMIAFQNAYHLYVNPRTNRRPSKRKYHKPEIDALKREWTELRNDEERTRFKEDRAAFVRESQKHCELLSAWQRLCQHKRSEEVYELKGERFKAIKVRLREEGFGEVFDHMRYSDLADLKRMSSVNRASKLTEKGWNIIRTSIVQYMTSVRDKYRAEASYRKYLKRFQNLFDAYQSSNTPRTQEWDYEPGFFDLATSPAIRGLLEDGSGNITQDFHNFYVHMSDFAKTWKDHYWNIFTQLAVKGLGKFSASLEQDTLLNLAIVSFVCKRCHQRQLRWPHLLSHRCFRDRSRIEPKGTNELLAAQHVRSDHDARYRGEELVVFDDHNIVTRTIVSLCGFTPELATCYEMNDQDVSVRLVCSLCPTEGLEKWQVFDWQAAIQHSIACHSTEGVNAASCWGRISPRQAALTKALERLLAQRNSTLSALSHNPMNVFGCALCCSNGSIDNIRNHLFSVHRILSPKLGEHMYLHEDSKPCGAPSVWMDLFAQPFLSSVYLVPVLV
ncbi:hypothetical protein DICSQDRAFT_152678 [Dichomitus squalens LYAD-421 SS1]|uniref:uncharacterized protein n=1 Tax=Dichomitus squalens (strain LYAD-421) TaxID=732165 RepID=UPI0004414C76|nr:uncharacterized protein DICSQDRAFT_152678 [Dichomitus squalens LYAD-421 SS1]EJF65483.1 hypothetical protein DICSQDRAFT_152678 [Dichomitus squalens LYAD-421 SS1]